MRVAFLFGQVSVGDRPFDFSQIETSKRGLTGTDGSFLYYARAMADRGHDVTLFIDKQIEYSTWNGIKIRPYVERGSVDRSWDAACAWNDFASLREVSPSCARICNMQLNNFDYARPGDFDFVDQFVAPSNSLIANLKPLGPSHVPWRVLYNGCNPQDFSRISKVPGKCIYASSPDRGLHLLLQQWGKIRAAVPYARLKVFYHSLPHYFDRIDYLLNSTTHPSDKEHGRRASIIRDLIKSDGVEYVGSVSRARMAQEYSEAKLLTYPCDPTSYTEGYAVAIMEGCASGAVPVISDVDALTEIYGGVCPMVESPAHEHIEKWTNLTIEMLVNEDKYSHYQKLGWAHSEKFSYSVLVKDLERIITDVRATK